MSMNGATSGQEIIDATQSAIIQAVDKVSELIEPTAHHGHGPFYQNPEFWVGMAFVFVVLMLSRPLSKVFSTMMKKRIEGIANRIDEAAQLKDDAQKLLADYEAKFQNAKKEANALIKKSQKQVELLKQEYLQKLEADMNIHKREVDERISAAQDEAKKEIVSLTSDVTIGVVRNILKEKITPDMHDAFINHAIDEIA